MKKTIKLCMIIICIIIMQNSTKANDSLYIEINNDSIIVSDLKATKYNNIISINKKEKKISKNYLLPENTEGNSSENSIKNKFSNFKIYDNHFFWLNSYCYKTRYNFSLAKIKLDENKNDLNYRFINKNDALIYKREIPNKENILTKISFLNYYYNEALTNKEYINYDFVNIDNIHIYLLISFSKEIDLNNGQKIEKHMELWKYKDSNPSDDFDINEWQLITKKNDITLDNFKLIKLNKKILIVCENGLILDMKVENDDFKIIELAKNVFNKQDNIIIINELNNLYIIKKTINNIYEKIYILNNNEIKNELDIEKFILMYKENILYINKTHDKNINIIEKTNNNSNKHNENIIDKMFK